MVDDGGELEAQAFAEAGGGLEEDITAFEGCDDDLSLDRSEEGQLMPLMVRQRDGSDRKLFLPNTLRSVKLMSMF